MAGRFIQTLVLIAAATILTASLTGCGGSKSIEAGTSWEIEDTTKFRKLTIADASTITAPAGYSGTMTVDGVETPMVPGSYEGDIVLTKTEENVVRYNDLTHRFRQALFLDDRGIVPEKSVLSAVSKENISDDSLNDFTITSAGECFNGIYAAGGAHTVENLTVNFTGNGGDDFAGFGAAVMSTGKETVLVLDGVDITTRGAVRTGLVADGGSRLIVKNSRISTSDGVLPDDYIPTISMGAMMSAPWMLGITGNCRATNLLGENTAAAYINSYIAAENWGVFSTDDCQDVILTAINSEIAITGDSGYGAFSIGNATERFLGCTFHVPDYGLNLVNGTAIFDDSTPESVRQLNTELGLGLTGEELADLEERRTTVTSGRFGVMCGGTLKIGGGTTFDCGKTVFLIKNAPADIQVDGSSGALLHTGSGTLLQLMESDDAGPGPDMRIADQTYSDPVGEIDPDPAHDTTAVHEDTDAKAMFSSISLKGDFYNSTRGAGKSDSEIDVTDGGAGTAYSPGIAVTGGEETGIPGLPGMGGAVSRNLVLTFSDSDITGVISAATARHAKPTITAGDYRLLGEVTNTPCPAVNNGVIVSLTDSTWTVTGTSYLTSLTLDKDSAIATPDGRRLTLTVDGAERKIQTGTYKGDIVLSITNEQPAKINL
jgi:uncharacterized lipoprotein YehR (DUF1307 family)